MDDTFQKLKKDGLNDVKNLMQWMKDSKILEETEEAERRARQLFRKIKDEHNVELENFIEVVMQLAEEQKKTLEQCTEMLIGALPKLHEALKAAATAFQ